MKITWLALLKQDYCVYLQEVASILIAFDKHREWLLKDVLIK